MLHSWYRLRAVALLPALFTLMVQWTRADVILQHFESRWETIEHRVPDIFMAGYDAIWVPPTSVADTGGYSVGYDVFDRFNLGNPNWQSLYGTENGLLQMVNQLHRAGVLFYPDLVMNHNGFRDLSTPGFVEAGDYPGVAVTLPSDIDGDFHGIFEGGDLNGRLAGLIDLAQEKEHRFYRHPVFPGDSQNIPFETATESNRRFYLDTDFNSPASLGDTSGDRHTPSGFNLDNPLAGDPVVENLNEYLSRHARWMVEVVGADGFRLDAVKHVPTWFWNDIYDPALVGIGTGGSTPFSFGEVFDGDFGLLSSYTRKDGFGNRDVLDFPLYFTMSDVFGASGFGDMSRLEYASFDGSDGDANDGTRGVQFVSSHDRGAPGADNLAYAHILTRPGYPLVYFNAHEFGDGRDFPQSGRGDALGGEFGDIITTLIDIHHEHGRGAHHTRWIDGDVYVYERENSMVVGLNDNGAFASDRDLFNLAFRNVTLVELTGNPGAPSTLAVDGTGYARITIPSNANGLGYAIYGPQAPRGSTTIDPFDISPVASVIAPDDGSVPNGVRRITPIDVITSDSATLTLTLEAEGLDDAAIFQVSDGGFSGFDSASPSFGGGSGIYSSTIDLTSLAEGMHFIEARAFLHREPNTLPAIWETFRRVVYVDRQAPQVSLLFPEQTGSGDVLSREYEVVLESTDATADSVHVLIDFSGNDAEAIAAINEGNRASRVDRTEFRYLWTDIVNGTHSITAVAFEPSGNASVTQFTGIDVSVAMPALQFENLPDRVNSAEYDDIRILVDTTNPSGDPLFFDPTSGDPAAFDLALTIDGVTYEAQAFDPGLIGSENTLYQQDDDLGDSSDVFRFNWRGYDRGLHDFEVSAELFNTATAPSTIQRSVQVSGSVEGPDFKIVSPAPAAGPTSPPTLLLIDPSEIAVMVSDLESTARSLTLFIQAGESERLLTSQSVDGQQSSVTVTASVEAIDLFNGATPIRIQASTAPLGGGITRDRSTSVLILGRSDFAPPAGEHVVDGQDNDWIGTPSAQIHTAAVSEGEWIYTGEAGDVRTDLGDDTDISNTSDTGDFINDLTELRITQDESNIHFLVRMRDIVDVRRASFGIAIDTDSAGALGFIGDESDTWLDTSGGNTWDFTVQVHFVNTGISRVEIFDDTGDPVWFSPEGEQSYISAESDLIEFAIPRSVLGLDGDQAEVISIQGATFENLLTDENGYNNDVDSTRDIGDENNPDALDVLGGEPGVSANSYSRAFSEGGLDTVIASDDPNVVLIYTLTIPSPADSVATEPPTIQSISPPGGSEFATPDPVSVEVVTDTNANSVIVAVNGNVAAGMVTSSAASTTTWGATASTLQEGGNSIAVVGFSGSLFTGRTDLDLLIYVVQPASLNVQAILDQLLGIEPWPGGININGDNREDVADLVHFINGD